MRRVDALAVGFDEIVDAAADVATDDEHDPEGHTIAWERQQTAALLDDARVTVARLDAALRRVDDGTYGRCANCNSPIPVERLEALPSTSFCVDCAT